MADEDFKDLAKRTASDKLFENTAFKIVSNPRYDGYQRDLSSTAYTFFDKMSTHLQIHLLQILVLKMKDNT